jgi:hypothetical protein
MTEHELELRLRAVARALDADAPAFEPAVLPAPSRRRGGHTLVALAAVAALTIVAAAPAAISVLRDFLDVELVQELPVVTDAAPPFLGRSVPLDVAATTVSFRVRTIPLLGTPDGYHMREDIRGGMVTVAYGGTGTLLTQWQVPDVSTRISVVPVGGTAEDVTAGGLSALWIAGTARGIFTVIGADGAIHKELFDVAAGALLWEDDGVAFLLQGAGTQERAARLAADVTP